MKKRLSLLAVILSFTLTTAVSQVWIPVLTSSVAMVKASLITAEDNTNLTIKVPTAGLLSNVLPVEQASMVKQLKITGYINNVDIDYLRSYTPVLTNLDMSEAVYYTSTLQSSALSGKTSLARVKLPKHLTSIGNSAFNGCTALQRVILPDSLRSLSYNVFLNCIVLDSVILPEKLQSIDWDSFRNCNKLQSISFPKGFTSLSTGVFYDCTGLKTVMLSDTLTKLNGSTFRNCTSLKNIHLPNKLSFIYDYVFYNCKALDSIAFPVSLTAIGYEAFSYSSSLKSVVLPTNLTSIAELAFRECTGLEKAILPANLQTVNNYVFYNCTSLKTLKLSDKLQTIGYQSFYNCASLQKLKIPNTLQTIGSNAFQYCSKLDTLILPPTVIRIDSYAFSNCSSLRVANLPSNLTVLSEGLFSNCSSLDSIIIPIGLTQIGHNAFRECNSLKGQLVLPEFLTYLGSQAFYNCGYSTCKALPATPPTLYNTSSLGNLRVVFVPKNSEAAYKSAWSGYMIIGGDTLTSVNVDLTSAGTLGDEILKKVSYLKDVHKLTVSGPMNTTDMAVIQQSMPSLVSLNLKHAQLVQIPDNQFNGKELLLEVILPDSLETIGNQAFRGCINLTTIRIPEKVKSLSNYTFYSCSNLVSIDFTEGLTSIGYECFYNCYSLEKLVLPQSLVNMDPEIFIYCYKLKSVNIPPKVKTLNYNTFYNCTSLESVTFSDGLTSMGTSVFYDCALTNLVLPDNLTSIDDYAFYSNNINTLALPAKLVNLGSYSFAYCPIDSLKLPAGLNNIENGAFGYCTSLKDIRCEQPTPPVLSNDPFVGFDKTKCSLTVSSWAANMYKQANIWSSFYPVYTYNTMVKELPISGNLVLSDNVRPLGTPNVTVLNTGTLKVSGNAPMTINQFKTNVALNRSYYYGYVDSYGQLISESPSITANRVGIDMSAYAGLWYYLAFPFDARVDSMTVNNSAQFVFRAYDGAARAANGAGSSWKTMTKDSVLKAGAGYVYQSNVDALLSIVSTEATKNQVFNSTARNISLKEFASTSPSNKNWNFIGNPFPSFFDVFYVDFTAPITVWNYANSTYQALSLADDDYILKPYEAFFVQKPNDLAQISFRPDGRQLTNAIRANRSTMAKLRSATDRTLINLNISNETYADKCRVVINPSASLSYELEFDATKFMSGQPSVPQLYTLDDTGIRYAINERPLESGMINLGCYIGETGTYTLGANNFAQEGDILILTDKLLKKQTTLNLESYQFSAETGTYENRFELTFLRNATQLETNGDNKSSVWCTDGTINIMTKAGNKVSVYALNGILVNEIVSKGTQIQISLEKGVYLVKVAGRTFKSVVF